MCDLVIRSVNLILVAVILNAFLAQERNYELKYFKRDYFLLCIRLIIFYLILE
jgi:hypothetical protein